MARLSAFQGYVMRAESPAAAQNWVEVLNRIRVLKDDTEEDAMGVSDACDGVCECERIERAAFFLAVQESRKAEETFCFCFKRTKSDFSASAKKGDVDTL